LSDAALHAAARRLTARSNVTLADLLAHLGEVERRGIHRNRACASLYTYCIYELRMSEDAAFRRAKAARLVHRHPVLHGLISRGEIHLTGLLMIAPYLGGERHAEILERARFRTKRELTRIIAEIDPKPPVAPRIVPVAPSRAGGATHAAFAEALAGPVRSLPVGDRPEDWAAPEAGEAEDLTRAERALEGARESRQAPLDRPMSYEVRFTASQEFVDLLTEALDLLGEPRQAARLPTVQLRALRELVARLRRRKTGRHAAPARRDEAARGETPARETNAAPERDARTEPTETPARAAPERRAETNGDAAAIASRTSRPTHGRYIPAAVRRAVWDRDEARCAYADDRGCRCTETRRLEVHHRRPYALGGPATVDNLELRCRAHNTLAAEEDFGRAHMRWMRGDPIPPPRSPAAPHTSAARSRPDPQPPHVGTAWVRGVGGGERVGVGVRHGDRVGES
jgi:hypothetical protein